MICALCHLPLTRLYRGACARCNTARLRAAVEYIHAAEAIRLMTLPGSQDVGRHLRRRPPIGRDWLSHAISRLHYANQECLRLKLWPAERSTKKPPWFYGDERSNTA